MDKFGRFNIATQPSERLSAPRLAGSYACLECRVFASHNAATHWVYEAEVVAYVVDKGRGPLVWHQGRYFALGTPLA
jgi:flavin reductase (DIM6/NTAB) family NADH-FMN oxidoreductase RutF